MEELYLFGVVVRGVELFRFAREDREMMDGMPPRPLAGLTYVHEVLACLIAGVYARDKDEVDYERYWQSVQYEPLEPRALGLGDVGDRNLVAVPDAPYARLMLFRRVNQGLPLENEVEDAQQVVRWPLYVVAIRGTIPGRLPDLVDNVRVLFETMYRTVALYQPVLRLLRAIEKEYGRDMWVTGHSLGGILGLIATRRLAIDPQGTITLDAHFFNSPNVSLDVLIKKLFRGSVNGLAAGARRIWFVGGPVSTLIRGVGNFAVRSAELVSREAMESLFPEVFHAAGGEFQELRGSGYIPHLYVNPNDAICNEYIQHFQGHQPPPVSNAVPITQIFIDSESGHLIPQAILHINHWALGPHEAHKLHQWYLYPLVNIRSVRVGAR